MASRNKCLLGLIAVAGMLLGGAASASPYAEKNSAPRPRDDADLIMSRIGPPSEQTLSTYTASGMLGVTEHHLTGAEKDRVRLTVLQLPPYIRGMLALHLHRLSFVDGVPGVGSALTVGLGPTRATSDMTFRASIFGESLTQFLTHKEQRCFQNDGRGIKVRFQGGDADAFTYVLLHEATHVVDFAIGISALQGTQTHQSVFFRGVWTGLSTLAPQYSSRIFSFNVFREAKGGRPFKSENAAQVYDSLRTSPFVDLFATANEAEDLSSLVAFYELWKNHHVRPEIIVTDRSGRTLFRYRSVETSEVRSRFHLVEDLLKREAS